MKEFDTYVFDLDGTLLETLNDLAASTNYALRTNNFPEHTVEEVRMFVGNGVKKLIERAIPNGLENPKFNTVLDSSANIIWNTTSIQPILTKVFPNCSKN